MIGQNALQICLFLLHCWMLLFNFLVDEIISFIDHIVDCCHSLRDLIMKKSFVVLLHVNGYLVLLLKLQLGQFLSCL